MNDNSSKVRLLTFNLCAVLALYHFIMNLCAINSIHSHLNVTNPLFKLNTYLQNLKNKNKEERKNPMNSIWSDNTISN